MKKENIPVAQETSTSLGPFFHSAVLLLLLIPVSSPHPVVGLCRLLLVWQCPPIVIAPTVHPASSCSQRWGQVPLCCHPIVSCHHWIPPTIHPMSSGS